MLQGFTVTNEKIFFMSSNNKNAEKGVLYYYLLYDLNNIQEIDYSNTDQGNRMIYITKTGKVLTSDYYCVC